VLPFSKLKGALLTKKNIEEQHNRNQKNENEKQGKATWPKLEGALHTKNLCKALKEMF